MLCEECGKNEANVKLVQIINGEKTEKYVCEECARKSGEFPFSFDNMGLSFGNLLSGLFDFGATSVKTSRKAVMPRMSACKSCQLSLAEFSQTGRLGCDTCYTDFQSQLEPLLRRIHGNTKHTGKIPKRRGEKASLKRKIEELRRKLRAAVAAEHFEDAAVLRDKIRGLEQQLPKEGSQ